MHLIIWWSSEIVTIAYHVVKNMTMKRHLIQVQNYGTKFLKKWKIPNILRKIKDKIRVGFQKLLLQIMYVNYSLNMLATNLVQIFLIVFFSRWHCGSPILLPFDFTRGGNTNRSPYTFALLAGANSGLSTMRVVHINHHWWYDRRLSTYVNFKLIIMMMMMIIIIIIIIIIYCQVDINFEKSLLDLMLSPVWINLARGIKTTIDYSSLAKSK